jgi:hypothetical protein
MSSLDRESEVRDLADELGLWSPHGPVEAIVEHCRRRVDRWVAADGPVSSIEELESIVARHLGMVFEDVWSDEDLDAVIDKYVRLGEGVFKFLKHDLAGPTFGATYRRKKSGFDAPDRLVAIIDCRGEKGARRFFTRWHEAAHFLAGPGEVETPVFRSSDAPLERLMDEIAASVGFYEPIFGPAYDAEMTSRPRLTFEAVDSLRRHFADASFQATLFAFHRKMTSPVLYLEASLAHKADERRNINRGSTWLFEDAKPEAKLRAVQVVPNAAAQVAGLFIAPNMRVPESSVIHRLHDDESAVEASDREDLGMWEHSRGKHLESRKVWVEAKKFKERVIAIVQP